MTTVPATTAFLVTAPPCRNRVARSEVDFVLSALALDETVHVFFLGAALMQLARDRDLKGAGLGPGYKAWSALPDFGVAQLYGESRWIDWCRERGVRLVADPVALDARDMRAEWQRCARVLVL